ncbi:uncharacterized protein LOC112454735 [Temnothorax curvispinosus]|uniref:Uncharacterized protein LOC112454735 n=1 Tax=Temnothorax curvispinosus TaxID=300111 RepID=A0A6J1PQQ6_9HYME|nr:uncharacterized protein LOC112454735 [Temnothorax curvispinosus]
MCDRGEAAGEEPRDARENVARPTGRSASGGDASENDTRPAVRGGIAGVARENVARLTEKNAGNASESDSRPAERIETTSDAQRNIARLTERNLTAGNAGENLYRVGSNVASVGNQISYAGDAAAGAGLGLGYKVKPDTYDGTVPLHEYLSQFNLIARANSWNNATKTVALASSLRGKARSILETVQDVDCLDFAELEAKLELRFGEGHLTQNSYSALTNRRQRFGEDLATLGFDIERLSRLAYPECPYEIRDKIACSQFVSAVSDNFVRRTLQIEGITSLSRAVERAKALKIIQGDNYAREKEKTNKSFPKEGQNNNFNGKKGTEGNGKQAEEEKNEQRGNSRGSKSASREGVNGARRGDHGRTSAEDSSKEVFF